MNTLHVYITALLCWVFIAPAISQETNLLDQLDGQNEKTYISNAFKSPRVINSHSIEMLAEGALDFRILHRFGEIGEGFENLFGLDNASMRMGFDYGITKNFTAGVGRSTAKKELDGFLKYRILHQSTGEKAMPFSVIWVSGMTYVTQKNPFNTDTISVKFAQRAGYYHQIIIGRKFTDRFSLQMVPTLVHQNVVNYEIQPNNLFAIGLGLRYKVTQRVAVVIDYSYPINRIPSSFHVHPLSIGVDIETGGHVFQLHFSNAIGMNERAYISDENGDWLRSDFRFGFNLSRVFQIKKRKLLDI